MIKKFKNALGYLLVFAIFLGSFINNPINISDAADNKAWDGKKIDVTWFNPDTYNKTEIYEIDSPEKLMGLAALVNGLYDKEIEIIGGESERKKIEVEKDEDVLLIPFDETYGDIHYGKYDFENKTIKITSDLDMGGQYDTKTQTWKETSPNYMPIGGGYAMNPDDPKNTLIKARFNGTFDGQGHSIKNVYINRYTPMHFGYSQGVGLIGAIGQKESGEKMPEQVVVKNIILESGYIYGRRMVGGIVGAANNTKQGVIIENCVNHATVKSTDKKGVGGIIGALNDPQGEVRNAYNTGKIINTGGFNAAGIAGELEGKVYKVVNTGEIDSRIPGEIAKVTDKDLASGDFYFWLDNGKNIGGLVEYGKEIDVKGRSNYGKKTKNEMASKEFLDLLNSDSETFYYEKDKGLKLLMEKKSTDKFKIEVVKSDEKFGKLITNPEKEGLFGQSVSIKEYTKAGYKLDKIVINGVDVNSKSSILTKDMIIEGKYSPLKSVKMILPGENDKYKLIVTKKGVAKKENKFEYVEDYPVLDGDTVYENDRIFVKIEKIDKSLNYNIEVENADKGTYDYEKKDNFYRVQGDKNPAIKVTSPQKPKTWADYGDTSWYDENSNAKSFKIENHEQLAGLAKICNSTEKLYKNENFAGKTIEITTDIRLRAANNRENKTNYIWEPIKGFKGTLEGNNNRISHIEIKGMPAYKDYNYSGLFGELIGDDKHKPAVRNLIVDGEINNNSGISSGSIGGLVGYAENAIIENCTNEIKIENETYEDIDIGGVIGIVKNSEIDNLKNYGDINSVRTVVGGIVGKAEGDKNYTIKNSINYGIIYQGTLKDLGADNNSKTGGIVGETYIPVEGCGNKGVVTGYNIVGGIAAESSSYIKDSYFTGEINFIDIPNYDSTVGGILGLSTSNKTILENTYSAGVVNLDEIFSRHNGVVGNSKFAGKYINSYYLKDTVIGGVDSKDVDGIKSISSEEMKSDEIINKLGKSFGKDNLKINKTYPILSFENKYYQDMDIEKIQSNSMVELSKYPNKKAYTEDNWKKINELFVEFNSKVLKEKEVEQIRLLLQEYKVKIDQIERDYKDNDEEGRVKKYKHLIGLSKKSLLEKIENPKVPNTDNKIKAKEIIEKADGYLNNEKIVSNELGKFLKEMYDLEEKLIEDNKAPEFKNIDDLEIEPVENFDLREGVLIIDEYQGAPEPTFKIDEESLKTFDSMTPGNYIVVYIGQDSVGNETKYTRKITVKGKINYDLNGDGRIDSSDVNILEKNIGFGSNNLNKYDLNKDGRIDSLDVNILEKIISNS